MTHYIAFLLGALIAYIYYVVVSLFVPRKTRTVKCYYYNRFVGKVCTYDREVVDTNLW